MSADDAQAMLDRASIIDGLHDLGLDVSEVHRHDSRTRSWCVAVGRPGGRRLVHVGEHCYVGEIYSGVTISKRKGFDVCGMREHQVVARTLRMVFALVHGANFDQLCATLKASR